MLFYLLCAALALNGGSTPAFVAAAWGYVGLRALHSLIHVTYNRVVHRFLVYVASTLLLFGMWVAFFAQDRAVSEFEGRCLCGAVRFAVTPPTLFFAHCHCRWCREAHGAAFVSWVGCAEDRFRFLPGSAQPTLVCILAAEPARVLFHLRHDALLRLDDLPRRDPRRAAGDTGTDRPRAAVPRVPRPARRVGRARRRVAALRHRRSRAREVQGGFAADRERRSVVDRLGAHGPAAHVGERPVARALGRKRFGQSRRIGGNGDDHPARRIARARGPGARPRLPRRRRG